jgi:hypothetical protein
MKFSLILGIYIFLLCITSASSQEKIEYQIDDNLLSVTIIDLNANCCSDFIADYHINYSNNLITLILTDTSEQKCRCNCNFDLSFKLGPLPQGKYTVSIIKEEYVKNGFNKDRKINLGKKDISVYDPHPKSALSMDFNQSVCKNTSISQPEDEVIPGGIVIFPNPSSGVVSIKFNLKSNSDVKLEILNFLGKSLNDFKFKGLKSGTNVVHLTLNELLPGMYIGKVIANNGQTYTFKLMWSK